VDLKISAITNSITSKKFEVKNQYRGGYQRKTWYTKKTSRTALQAHRIALAILDRNKFFYFITVTTLQHETQKSDTELLRVFARYCKFHGFDYLATVERQTELFGNRSEPTQDIHFHAIIGSKKRLYNRRKKGVSNTKWKFCFSSIFRLIQGFDIGYHPSVFDCRQIRVPQEIVSYIVKYAGKQGNKLCSLYQCRTLFYKKILAKHYRKIAHLYERKVNRADIYKSGTNLVLKKKGNFHNVYEFDKKLWDYANPILFCKVYKYMKGGNKMDG